MATIDLSLNALKIPALDNFTPDFGTMITETQANKGGLSTFEVNSNMMLPWSYMRPKVVVENSTTTEVEYDAKIVFSSSLQAGVTLTLGAATYEGCELLIKNLSSYACTVSKGAWSYSVPAGSYVKLEWDGSAWSADVSAAVHAAIGDAIEFETSTTVKASMKTSATGVIGTQSGCYLIKFPNKKAIALAVVKSGDVPTAADCGYQIQITGATVLETLSLNAFQANNSLSYLGYCASYNDFWIRNLSTSSGICWGRALLLVQLP